MTTDVSTELETQQLSRQTAFWIDLAEHTAIHDQPSVEMAAGHLQAIAELKREADKTFDPIISKAHAAHKEALSQKKRIVQPLDEAEVIIKKKLGAWTQEQQRIRFEEERRLREEAERQAAEEREKELEAAEALGATADEVQALAEAPLVRKPILVAAPLKPTGISTREIWKAEVTDVVALIQYVAAHPEYADLLAPNMPAINALARSRRSMLRIPGVKVWNEANIATLRRSS
jgi:hypothetical protein